MSIGLALDLGELKLLVAEAHTNIEKIPLSSLRSKLQLVPNIIGVCTTTSISILMHFYSFSDVKLMRHVSNKVPQTLVPCDDLSLKGYDL